MSKFEQEVSFNLSESGVHPMALRELVGAHPGLLDDLLATELNYPHVNGIPQLRENIALLYEGALPENILVTVGAIEANYITIRTLLSPGENIVVMLPNYMQIWGVAKNLYFEVKTFDLREAWGWAPDLDQLNDRVTSKTRLIAVCNPNNPTGRILTSDEMDTMVSIADRVGAWILADEVYAGAERLADEQTPSFYGKYPKVIAIGSMSKAYGLPGLRLGWAVGPPNTIEEIWSRHEYTTISATMLSNKLAAYALSPDVRPRIIKRTRDFIRGGYPILQRWIEAHSDTFRIVPPQAAAIAFPRYRLDINSTTLSDRLRVDKSVMIVPGDHFGMDHFFRISFGLPKEQLVPALNRIHDLITALDR